MGTLFYSPGIEVLIKTNRHGIVNVSDDITVWDMQLRADALHDFSCTMSNPRRKYDGIFTPNDRIVVRLKRVRWLQTFAGYLNGVPFFSAYPRDVDVTASCTLKRLKMTYWDPGTTASIDFLNSLQFVNTESEISGGLTARAVGLLTEVARWPKDAIHMGRIPADWTKTVSKLMVELQDDYQFAEQLLGAGASYTADTSASALQNEKFNDAQSSSASSSSSKGGASGAQDEKFSGSNEGVGIAPTTKVPSSVQFKAVPDNGGTLQANAAAARSFIQQSWNITRGIGGYASSGHVKASYHYRGLALDVMVSVGRAQGNDLALGNSVALWFAANPLAFGVDQIIWMDKINTGSGWRPYDHPGSNNDTLQHRDHVHISFTAGQNRLGAMGSPWPGGTHEEFRQQFAGGFSADGPTGGPQMLQAANWSVTGTEESDILYGERALMNDVPVLESVTQFIGASMRSYCAAPNGDLIGWFPDYFGIYGLAGQMRVHNIELKDFTLDWSDLELVTHQYTAGTGPGGTGIGSETAQVEVGLRKAITMGIASVEHPEIMEALLNVSRNDPNSAGWTNPDAILQRFGARPNFVGMEAIASEEAEFWFALHLFQKNWASQFSAQVPLTFMPELFPGMLLRLEEYGIQFYIEGVAHHGDHQSGYTTTASVSAPSSIGGKGFAGLVRGGG